MNERVLRVLEFTKIKEQLKSHAATALGKDEAVKLYPSHHLNEVIWKQKETDEAATVLRLHGGIPLGGIHDIRSNIGRAVIGGVLSTTECLDVANTIYGGRQAKDFIEKLEENLPILQELTNQITPLRSLETAIKSCIDDHGHVMDGASVKLRGIRSSIRTFESRVRDRLDNYIKTKSSLLSDAIITIRNDRYVLPVKQEHRGAVG